uniref:Transmembrane protein n=1 Tax=Cacopsylla melanoneura TaxID=428564 RepID=A0A8D8T6Y5_9HEMI
MVVGGGCQSGDRGFVDDLVLFAVLGVGVLLVLDVEYLNWFLGWFSRWCSVHWRRRQTLIRIFNNDLNNGFGIMRMRVIGSRVIQRGTVLLANSFVNPSGPALIVR